jgi:hypothetical protein
MPKDPNLSSIIQIIEIVFPKDLLFASILFHLIENKI